jgi:hypothetical protein
MKDPLDFAAQIPGAEEHNAIRPVSQEVQFTAFPGFRASSAF